MFSVQIVRLIFKPMGLNWQEAKFGGIVIEFALVDYFRSEFVGKIFATKSIKTNPIWIEEFKIDQKKFEFNQKRSKLTQFN